VAPDESGTQKAVAVAAGVVAGAAVAGVLYAIFGPKCPNCGAIVLPGQTQCRRCGRFLG
jgi:uncharacterized OB-fold protein